MDEFIVSTRGLTKMYGGPVLAVSDLDLNVRHGEVYGFLGPNGAGKTTTLRMLVGLVQPTSGTAVVAGHPPGNPAGLARVGSLVESPAFWPYLSGRDNLSALAHYCDASPRQVDRALAEVELTERQGDKFATYSMGMKQRLGVAAALLKEPELLILDEPTNGLDPQGMVEMRTFIRELAQGQRTVLLSSHLLNEVEHICDRVGVIQRGKLIAEGTVKELRGEPEIMVRATPVERAAEVVVSMLGASLVRQADGVLHIAADAGRAAEINRGLVTAGLEVSELRPASRSLEEVFLELTGQESGL